MFSSIARRVAPVGAVAALLLANGCGLLPAAVGAPSFQAATLASADAWSFTDVTLRPSVQQALYARDVFNFFADQTGPGGPLSQLPTPSGGSIDFEKDLLPHLDGEVAVALSGNPDQVLMVALVHTDDTDALIRLLAQDAAPNLTKDARGATRYTSGDMSVAGYKHWILVASNADMLTQTLDRIDGKGSPSLATQPRYQSAIDRLDGDRIGYGYLDITPLLGSSAFRNVPASSRAYARGRLAYSLAFGAGPQGGMRALDLRSEYLAEGPPPPLATDRGDALLAMDQLPVGDAVAFSGASIGEVTDALATLPGDVVPDDALNVLDAFAGPFSVGVSPVSSAGQDRSSPLTSLSFLGQLKPNIDADAVQGLIATALDSSGYATDLLPYEVVTGGDWTAINAITPPLTLDQIDQRELASDQMYQAVRPAFARDGSNMYVNVGALLAWAQEQGATLPEEAASVRQIRAIGSSGRIEANGDAHGRVLIVIGS